MKLKEAVPSNISSLNTVVFDANSVDLKKLDSEIDAPFVRSQLSTLGGSDRATIMTVVSLDPKEKWNNGILENSRYFRTSLNRNGDLEQFTLSLYPLPSKGLGFRKTKVKSLNEFITKINVYIMKLKDITHEKLQSNI